MDIEELRELQNKVQIECQLIFDKGVKSVEDKIKDKLEKYNGAYMTININNRSAGKTFKQAVNYEVRKVLNELLQSGQESDQEGGQEDEQVIKSMETTLNLIDKQQKEIEELRQFKKEVNEIIKYADDTAEPTYWNIRKLLRLGENTEILSKKEIIERYKNNSLLEKLDGGE